MKAVVWIIVVLLLVALWVGVRAHQNRNSSGAHADPKVYFGLRNMMLRGSRAKVLQYDIVADLHLTADFKGDRA
jgi:hypothetical protein